MERKSMADEGEGAPSWTAEGGGGGLVVFADDDGGDGGGGDEDAEAMRKTLGGAWGERDLNVSCWVEEREGGKEKKRESKTRHPLPILFGFFMGFHFSQFLHFSYSVGFGTWKKQSLNIPVAKVFYFLNTSIFFFWNFKYINITLRYFVKKTIVLWVLGIHECEYCGFLTSLVQFPL